MNKEIVKSLAAAVLAATNLGCSAADSKENIISLHCSSSHAQPPQPLSTVDRSRHLDVEIYPVTEIVRRSGNLTVVVVGYKYTLSRFSKEVIQVHDQDPNATRIAHLPPSLSVTLGDRVEVSLGALTKNQIDDKQGRYIASAPITAGAMSCTHS